MVIEISSTTPKIAAASPVICIAASRKTVAVTPESRLTRTGVLSRA